MPLRHLLAAALILLALGLGGCGSDSGATTGSGSSAPAAPSAPAEAKAHPPHERGGSQGPDRQAAGGEGGKGAAANPEPAFTPQPHTDSGGGAKQFEVKGGDNSIQTYGGEPSDSELAAAATALHNFLDARAARAWAAACEYLAPAISRELARQLGGGGKGSSCATVLAGLSAGVPDFALREAAIADVGALRAEGDRGFLLFRGAEGTDYFIPMVREDGRWRVAAIAPSAIS